MTALASASHSISFAQGVPDNEGLTVDDAIRAARIIAGAVDLPVSIDFEKGYAPDAAGVGANVRRLIEESGAVGINLEDSLASANAPQRDIDSSVARVAAARSGRRRHRHPPGDQRPGGHPRRRRQLGRGRQRAPTPTSRRAPT